MSAYAPAVNGLRKPYMQAYAPKAASTHQTARTHGCSSQRLSAEPAGGGDSLAVFMR